MKYNRVNKSDRKFEYIKKAPIFLLKSEEFEQMLFFKQTGKRLSIYTNQFIKKRKSI